MREYEIFLKNEKVKFYNRFGWLIIILNYIAITYISYLRSWFQEMKWILVVFTLLLAACPVYRVVKNKYFPGDANFWPLFAVIIPGWFMLEFVWIAGINAVLAFFSVLTMKTPVVYIGSEQIIYPSFPKRKIQWTELNNVMLKDGLLTIDFKNNKLIQQSTDDSLSAVNEKEFNDFCRQQLKIKQVI
jgi:hypothetical protein